MVIKTRYVDKLSKAMEASIDARVGACDGSLLIDDDVGTGAGSLSICDGSSGGSFPLDNDVGIGDGSRLIGDTVGTASGAVFLSDGNQ